MSKAVFVNGNVHGHINPTLPVVKELVERGEEVYYISTADFKQKVEASRAEFIDYGEHLYNFLKGFRPSGNHPFYTLVEFMLKMDETAIPLVLEKAYEIKPDYIIHDAMFGGGSFAAEILKLPAVCSCTSFAMNRLPLPPHMLERGFHPQLDNFLDGMDRLSNEWNIKIPDIMDVFFKKESLNIVFTSRLFQPEENSYDDSFKFVGPSIAERNEKLDFDMNVPAGRKVIYISMGTINNKCIDFYNKCIEAFKDEAFKVIMSVGNKVDISSLGDIPDNFIVENYVPQLEVLKSTDVFISHGGLNSVSEALYNGVPVISIPQANDQPMVTKQLAEVGAGAGLKMEEVTPQVLKEMVNKMLDENSFRNSCDRVKKSFIEAGGYKAAAEYILKYKSKSL